jgi:hypothetical protein
MVEPLLIRGSSNSVSLASCSQRDRGLAMPTWESFEVALRGFESGSSACAFCTSLNPDSDERYRSPTPRRGGGPRQSEEFLPPSWEDRYPRRCATQATASIAMMMDISTMPSPIASGRSPLEVIAVATGEDVRM